MIIRLRYLPWIIFDYIILYLLLLLELKNNDKIKYEIYNCYNSCELGYFFSLVYC